MNKIYKFFIIITISVIGIFSVSRLSVSANSITEGFVISVDQANMELVIRNGETEYNIPIDDLSIALRSIYFNADDLFLQGFIGAKIIWNSTISSWDFDRTYPFIYWKEQEAFKSGAESNWQYVYDTAFEAGRKAGLTVGENEGYNRGYDEGYQQGLQTGKANGYIDGFTAGQQLVNGDYRDYQLIAVAPGDLYYNWIDFNTMQFHRNVKQMILNGTENWYFAENLSSGNTILVSLILTNYVNTVEIDVNAHDTNTASSNYLQQKYIYNVDQNGFFIDKYGNEYRLYLRIDKNQIFNWNESWTNTQKLNSIKNFLTENPLVINYRIYEQIEIISEQILLNIGVYQQGYLTGIHYGKIEGESIGIRKGKDLGYQEAMDLRWIRAIFTAFSSFFAIKLFGDITVGVLVGVPIFITLALWLFRLVRGE